MLLVPGKCVRLEGFGCPIIAEGYGHILWQAVLWVMIGGAVREELCIEGDPVQEGRPSSRTVLEHCDVVITKVLQQAVV